MKRDYLGDSYDAVKRLWREVLSDLAPLYANSQFIPVEMREEYVQLTGINMIPETVPLRYSIINDPDTGIRLPGQAN